MSLIKHLFAVLLVVAFVALNVFAQQQDEKGALLRGYRTGYSDGYMAGYRDTVERAKRDLSRHQEYTAGNRAYREAYGAIEDYRDGYQQGFETGYGTGFERREFDSALPANLKRRGAQTDNGATPTTATAATAPESSPALNTNAAPTDNAPAIINAVASNSDATIVIPPDTEIIVEMLAAINSDTAREGDKFLARIVAPNEINGSTIEGRIAKVKRPGRVTGNAELELTFNRVVINNQRWANFNATIIEALPMKNSNVKEISSEGVVQGQSSLKSDVVKVGVATGTGAVVGAVAAGPVGAAVGAGIGAGAGITGVLVTRGKEIKLQKGQQLRLRTNFESQIR